MVEIPDDRRYFRIGEASRIIGVEPYVLRYWESEFSQVRPRRADSRQRTYQKKDLEALLRIKELLYEEKMTIEGARKRLKQERNMAPETTKPHLKEIRDDLKAILRILA